MDFKALIQKIDSIDIPATPVAAPKLADPVVLEESMAIKVLAGVTPLTESILAEKKAKPDFLDMDKDGNKKEPMKKAAKDAKVKEASEHKDKDSFDKSAKPGDTVKTSKGTLTKTKTGVKHERKYTEGMESTAEMAHHHASEYAKHHKAGNLEMCMHHKESCEKCGGKISHGEMGECYHQHAGMNQGQPYNVQEGVIGAGVGAGLGALVGGPVGAVVGGGLGQAVTNSMTNETKKCTCETVGKTKCSVHGSMKEASTGDYSAKKARAGKDIGKPGKNFSKIAKSAGGGEKGKKIAGAVLKKQRANEAAKPDYIDLDKDGNKKEPMKKAAKDAKAKKPMKESVETKLTFVNALAIVKESNYTKQIDPKDEALWDWAQRVAKNKFTESAKADAFAAMTYERMGGDWDVCDTITE